jgi:tripartite-type tricarboxylate transporter receptor subunit TctC
MGRPYMLPPGVPQDRVDALRKAFMDTMKDKEFLAEADKVKLEITPVDGDKIQKLVEEIYKTSPDIIAKAGKLVK